MGFVKGVIAGVLGVAGVFVTAAVIDVVKDEKRRKEDMDSFMKKYQEKYRSQRKKEEEAEKEFDEKVGKVFENIKKNRSGVIHCAM